MDELYVAEATAHGARTGQVATSDGRLDPGDFTLAVDLVLDAPGVDEEQARALMAATHRVCPCARATTGDVQARLLTAGAQTGSA